MPDRIVRESILDSGRWLELGGEDRSAGAVGRLVYLCGLLRVDDFGNVEEGRVYRVAREVAEVDADRWAELVAELQAADLWRPYDVDGRAFLHFPRFQNRRRYTSRKCPASPWDSPELSTGEKLQAAAGKVALAKAVINQIKGKRSNPAADIPQTAGRTADNLLRGVGVGVGVGCKVSTSVGSGSEPSSLRAKGRPPRKTVDKPPEQPAESRRGLNPTPKPEPRPPASVAELATAATSKLGPEPTDADGNPTPDEIKRRDAEKQRQRRAAQDHQSNGSAKAPGLTPDKAPRHNGAGEWWRSDSGIMSKAAELSIKPRRGESYALLRSRCFEAIAATLREGK